MRTPRTLYGLSSMSMPVKQPSHMFHRRLWLGGLLGHRTLRLLQIGIPEGLMPENRDECAYQRRTLRDIPTI